MLMALTQMLEVRTTKSTISNSQNSQVKQNVKFHSFVSTYLIFLKVKRVKWDQNKTIPSLKMKHNTFKNAALLHLSFFFLQELSTVVHVSTEDAESVCHSLLETGK